MKKIFMALFLVGSCMPIYTADIPTMSFEDMLKENSEYLSAIYEAIGSDKNSLVCNVNKLKKLSLYDVNGVFMYPGLSDLPFDNLDNLAEFVDALLHNDAMPVVAEPTPVVEPKPSAVLMPKEYADLVYHLQTLQAKDVLTLHDMQFAKQAVVARYESNWNVRPDTMKAKDVMWPGSKEQYTLFHDYVNLGIHCLQVAHQTAYMQMHLQQYLHRLVHVAFIFCHTLIVKQSIGFYVTATALSVAGPLVKWGFGTPDIRDIGDGHVGNEMLRAMPAPGEYTRFQQELTVAQKLNKK